MFERIWHKTYPIQVLPRLDFESITVPEMLSGTAERYPNHKAITCDRETITYHRLNSLVCRFSRILMEIGVKKSQKVALLLPNTPQIIIAYQATLRIGAISVIIDPLYTEPELQYQINDSGALYIVTTNENLEKVLRFKAKSGLKVIVVSSKYDFSQGRRNRYNTGKMVSAEDPGVFQLYDLAGKYNDELVKDESRWDDVASIIYTRGTTGVSKGVMLTHANLSCNVQQYSSWMWNTIDGGETWIQVYPVCDNAGCTMLNSSIYKGWQTVLVPGATPEAVLRIIEEVKPTLLLGVYPLFAGLPNQRKLKELDLSSIKAIITVKGELTVKMLQRLQKVKDIPVINIYGLAEATPVAATPWDSYERAGTAGAPYPNTDLKIVDLFEGVREMPPGELGEIILSGPQVMKGYLNKPVETLDAIKDGWLYTGDIGFFDEDGYLTVVDRKKDLIVVNGFNVCPKEIDDLLCAHPKIVEACTIGVHRACRGEAIKTYIVLKAGEILNEEEIIEYCRKNIAPYKVPRKIEFMESLPKNSLGMVLRKDIRKLDRQGVDKIKK